jgi:hypothetical protein
MAVLAAPFSNLQKVACAIAGVFTAGALFFCVWMWNHATAIAVKDNLQSFQKEVNYQLLFLVILVTAILFLVLLISLLASIDSIRSSGKSDYKTVCKAGMPTTCQFAQEVIRILLFELIGACLAFIFSLLFSCELTAWQTARVDQIRLCLAFLALAPGACLVCLIITKELQTRRERCGAIGFSAWCQFAMPSVLVIERSFAIMGIVFALFSGKIAAAALSNSARAAVAASRGQLYQMDAHVLEDEAERLDLRGLFVRPSILPLIATANTDPLKAPSKIGTQIAKLDTMIAKLGTNAQWTSFASEFQKLSPDDQWAFLDSQIGVPGTDELWKQLARLYWDARLKLTLYPFAPDIAIAEIQNSQPARQSGTSLAAPSSSIPAAETLAAKVLEIRAGIDALIANKCDNVKHLYTFIYPDTRENVIIESDVEESCREHLLFLYNHIDELLDITHSAFDYHQDGIMRPEEMRTWLTNLNDIGPYPPLLAAYKNWVDEKYMSKDFFLSTNVMFSYKYLCDLAGDSSSKNEDEVTSYIEAYVWKKYMTDDLQWRDSGSNARDLDSYRSTTYKTPKDIRDPTEDDILGPAATK